MPPLMMSSGFTPKNAGCQSTMSASFPGSMDPISCATPWAIAYERYQNPELNAFMSRAPELDFTQG